MRRFFCERITSYFGHVVHRDGLNKTDKTGSRGRRRPQTTYADQVVKKDGDVSEPLGTEKYGNKPSEEMEIRNGMMSGTDDRIRREKINLQQCEKQ